MSMNLIRLKLNIETAQKIVPQLHKHCKAVDVSEIKFPVTVTIYHPLKCTKLNGNVICQYHPLKWTKLNGNV